MKTRNKVTTALAAAILGIGIGPYAIAGGGGQHASRGAAVNAAAVSMSDAIRTAEKEVGGRAIDAEVDRERRVYYYDVEILTPDGMKKEVRIDMKTGAVVKVENDGRYRG